MERHRVASPEAPCPQQRHRVACSSEVVVNGVAPDKFAPDKVAPDKFAPDKFAKCSFSEPPFGGALRRPGDEAFTFICWSLIVTAAS
jgi:hypothetical protein